MDRWEKLTGQRVATNADSKGFKLFAEVPAETAPPTPATEPESAPPIKSRPSRTGIDWAALEAAHAARFASLPADATDDELAARNAEIDASRQLPGRMVPLMDRWNGRKWVVWKERYITDEDLAAFTKKPSPANRPTQPSDATKNESDGNHPPPDGSENSPTHSPEAGQMPVIDGIQWENKFNRGNFTGVEAWHSPTGARNRAGKTYLGKLGKRQLAAWSKLPPAEFEQAAIAWIELKRLAKGVA